MRPAEARSLLRQVIKDSAAGESFSPSRLVLANHLVKITPEEERAHLQQMILLANAGANYAKDWILERLSTTGGVRA